MMGIELVESDSVWHNVTWHDTYATKIAVAGALLSFDAVPPSLGCYFIRLEWTYKNTSSPLAGR